MVAARGWAIVCLLFLLFLFGGRNQYMIFFCILRRIPYTPHKHSKLTPAPDGSHVRTYRNILRLRICRGVPGSPND